MFRLLLKKELKVFFTNKGNLAFMLFLPILMISIFSVALGNYIKADYGTFEEGKVLYYEEDASAEIMNRFWIITDKIADATGVTFEQTDDYEKAQEAVEASKAYGVIRITEEGFDYFRSTFNEPEGGELVRTLFVQLANAELSQTMSIQQVKLDIKQLDSKIYYTFSALAFCIMFMGVLIANSVYNEKELDTIERIKLSKAGIGGMMASKILTGICCGIVQVIVAFAFSNLILGVNWGNKLIWIVMVFILLILFSAVFGSVIGMISKNKSMCQSSVLMFSMLCGYMGGSITPLYLLENMPVLTTIIKISPLYWTNQALTSLYNGIVDEKTLYCICILIGLSVLVSLVFMLITTAGKKKFVSRKEAASV